MNISEVKISDIKIGDRFRKEMGDLEGLAQSINEGELLQPIGITPDHELVFGERRLRAYRDILGRETIPVRIVDVPSVLLGQIDENALRKDFTLTEQIAIVDSLGPFKHGGDRRSDQARNSDLGSLTLADACKLVGISEDTYRRTKVVIEHGVPELAEAMDANELSVHAAETLAQAPVETQKLCLSKGFNDQKPTAKAIKRIIRQAELDQQQALAATTPISLPNDVSSNDIQIWCGDCLTLMQDRVSPDSVEVVVTSIPYNVGVQYATYDDNLPEAEYLAWLDAVFAAIKLVLKDEGSFFLNVGGTRRQPWTAMRVAEVAGRHFCLQNEIIWVKSITVDGRSHGHFTPLNGDRYLNQCWEHVFHFAKTGDVKLDRLGVGVPYEDKGNLRRNRAEQDRRCGGDVWFIPHETTRDRSAKEFHPCVFPVELPERCIRLHGVKAEMVVLDPFNGVGGTTLAAARLGVKGIGIDLSPAYCKAAEKRLANQKRYVVPMVSAEPVVINSVVNGDCRDVIPRLPDNSIGLGIVSPPYAQQRDGLYPGVPENDYPAFTVDWMTRLWPKLTEDGSVLIVIDPHVENGVLADYVLRTQLALRDAGWKQHMPLIWLKADRCSLGHTGWPRHAYEQILWFSKTAKPFCNPKAGGEETDLEAPRIRYSNSSPGGKWARGIKRSTDVIDVPVGLTPKNVDHPAMFPIELAEQLIRIFCRPGGTVFDGFSGSGNSLLAAARLGHPFYGCDLVPKFVELAQRRLAEAGSVTLAG